MSIKYKCNPRKALNAILWLAHEMPGITKHQLVKVLFYTDKNHLNEYGRPVIGDLYTAMQYGPVGSSALDLLDGKDLALEWAGVDDRPFTVKGKSIYPGDTKPDLSVFSKSDMEALSDSCEKYGHLSFQGLVDITHAEPAWRDAEGHWVRYEDMIDATDGRDEMIEDLQESSLRMVV